MNTAALQTVEIEPAAKAEKSVIWLHGLGADGHDFESLVPELLMPPRPAVRFVFPHAPLRPVTINGGVRMRAWYDIVAIDRGAPQDAAGIRESAAGLRALVAREAERGVPPESIVLAGFSQGGAVVLHEGLRHPKRLGGLLALSTYLPLEDTLAAEAHPANAATPIFMAHGTLDPTVPFALGDGTRRLLVGRGHDVRFHPYPMGHSLCLEEVQDIRAFLLEALGERRLNYTRLGKSGLQVSRLALGCMSYGDPGWRPWVLGEDAAREHFKTALELGVNFFDTADMYSRGRSEEVTGKMLGEMASRHDVVIATKVFFPVEKGKNRSGLSRKHVLEACDASLRRLGTDFIDLYQIHRWDEETPAEEVMDALDRLVRAGKVRYLGASSMAAWQLARALHAADRRGLQRFVSMQNHYNLAYREEEREMIPLCLSEGLGLVPWSPLARGFLSGTRTRDSPRPTGRAQNDEFADNLYFKDADFRVLDAVRAVAQERGASPAQVALAWLLGRPGVDAPIVGATRTAHLQDLAKALDLELGEDERRRLEAPYEPHPVLGHTPPTPAEVARAQGR